MLILSQIFMLRSTETQGLTYDKQVETLSRTRLKWRDPPADGQKRRRREDIIHATTLVTPRKRR